MQQLRDLTARQLIESRATAYAQFVQCLYTMNGRDLVACEFFLERHPRSVHADVFRKALDGEYATKAASIGTTVPGNWGAPLSALTELSSAFTTLVRNASLINRIPGLRRVPFNLPVPVLNTGGEFHWVGQAAAKPITNLGFQSVTVAPAKGVGIIVVSDELLKGAPGSAPALRDAMIGGLAAFLDAQLTDPSVAAQVNVHPASLTNATTPTTATGDIAADVSQLLAEFFAARPGAVAPVVVTGPALAAAMALAGGFDDVRLDSTGTIAGLPVVISGHIGSKVIVLDAAAVAWAGADDIAVDYSRQAAVEVSSTPDGTTALTLLWQDNLAGLKTEQIVSWARADVSAVKFYDAAMVTP